MTDRDSSLLGSVKKRCYDTIRGTSAEAKTLQSSTIMGGTSLNTTGINGPVCILVNGMQGLTRDDLCDISLCSLTCLRS